MGPQLFSGWGVRTMAEGEGGFNPIGYHTGAVWPFDNAFIAWGLRRYGFKAEAARIAAGILDAAAYFSGGSPRRSRATSARSPCTRSNTRPPAARRRGRPARPCSLLRTMLGLEPVGEHLVMDPALPTASGISPC